MDDAWEEVIFDVGEGHLQPVILKEADRRVSHDCSYPEYLDDPIPPSCMATVGGRSHQYAKLPPGFGEVLCSVGGLWSKLIGIDRRAIPPELRVDIAVNCSKEVLHEEPTDRIHRASQTIVFSMKSALGYGNGVTQRA